MLNNGIVKCILVFTYCLLLGSCQLPYDIAIINGRVIDPATHTDQIRNVGIRGHRISTVTTKSIEGRITLNAKQLIVSPGFIDVLTYKSTNPTIEKYKVLDGVTTIVYGHDGAISPKHYFEYKNQKQHRINYAALTNGFFVRSRYPKKPLKKLQMYLNEGAIGIAITPEYYPVPFNYLLSLARLAKQNQVPLFLHLRYSSPKRELRGIDEAIKLAKLSHAAIHIMHVHSTGATYHPRAAMQRIAAARRQGLSITADVYPYTYWLTALWSERFDNFQQKYNLQYHDLIIGGTNQRLSATNFEAYKKRHVYVAVPPGTIPFRSLKIALQQPFVMVASDGQIKREVKPNSHPRGSGTFAKAFEVGKQIGLDLPTLINKVTYAPAQLFAPRSRQFAKRGCLKPGCIADITIFDPKRIANHATIEHPAQASVGIKWVLVNGKIEVRNGLLQAVFPGRALQ